MTAFARALNRYVRRGQVTPAEMAEVAGCSAVHLRAVVRGDKNLSHKKVERLSGWLVDERGLTEHVEGMLGVSGAVHFHPEEVENDDCLTEEIFDARQYAAAADSLLKAGDREEAAEQMRRSIKRSKAALADIEMPAQDA